MIKRMHSIQYIGVIGILILCTLFLSIATVFAEDPSATTKIEKQQSTSDVLQKQTDQFGAFTGKKGADLETFSTDPRLFAARVIYVGLGLLGTVFLMYTIYGGFLWMTSAGTEDKITKGKSIILNGVIGLAIILSAFGITKAVTRILQGQSEIPEGQPCILPESSFGNDPLQPDLQNWYYQEGLPPCDPTANIGQ